MQLQEYRHEPTQQLSDKATEAPDLSSVMCVQASCPWNQWSSCFSCCRCRCHTVRNTKTPSLLYNTLGVLFAGYSGYPVETIVACTEGTCVSQPRFRIHVYYLFPSWFISRAITITIMSITSGEISLSLAVKRVVPFSADIYRLAVSPGVDSVENIKALFRSGVASPHDLDQNGGTILKVSHILLLPRD